MLAAVVMTLGLLLGQAGGERIPSYDVTYRLDADGTLAVHEVITYDFGAEERHGIIREIPVRLRYDDTHDRRYPVHVTSVSSETAPDDYETSTSGSMLHLRIGDADRTITGVHTYVLDYEVEGSLNRFADHVELYWNVTGNGWPVPIDATTVTLSAPAAIGEVACFAGPSGSNLPCEEATASGDTAAFSHHGLGGYEGVTIVASLPPDAVPAGAADPVLEERWTVRRGFSVNPLTVGVALVLLVGSIVLVVRRAWHTGRDRRAVGSHVDQAFAEPGAPEETVPPFGFGEATVEFVPPDGLRPGQLGLLVDERAHPVDVTATIVDLATRGWLRIEQVGEDGWFRKPDWRLVRLRHEPVGLLEYERLLFDGLFEDAEDDAVLLSDLKQKFHERLQKVQSAMYDDAVERGWFRDRPDQVRLKWAIGGGALAVLAGAATPFVAANSTLGIVPLSLVPAGLLALAVSPNMAARTAAGTGVVRRALGFRRFIDESEAHRAQFAEQQHLFTEYLPYAVAFGATEKWARTFAGLDTPPPQPSWYVGMPGSTFDIGHFGSSLQGFSTTTAGTLVSTPGGSGGSGFGGGGFSGGGGGGGGGGSW